MSEQLPIQVSEVSAINMLNYCMTMATLQKKNYKFKIDIPYELLAKANGVSEEEAGQFPESALRVTVSLDWAEDSEEMEYSYE